MKPRMLTLSLTAVVLLLAVAVRSTLVRMRPPEEAIS